MENRRAYLAGLAAVILGVSAVALAAEVAAPQLYELLPFDYPGRLIRVCRTDYGICLIPFPVVPGTPCECVTADGTWIPGVSIH
jgi:hypothetical protein